MSEDNFKEVSMKIKKKSKFKLMKVLLMLPFLVVFVVLQSSSALFAVEDPCEIPDTDPLVIIDGCDTGVENVTDNQNCSIVDKILICADDAQNHGEFVSCVAHLTNALKQEKIITGKEKGKIQSCAANADIPGVKPDEFVSSGESPPFQFEIATDELSLALQKVYAAYTTPPTPDNMNEIQTLRHEGIAYLRNHPDEAAAALIAEALQLDPSNKKGLTTIAYLLGYFESVQGIHYLFTQVNHLIAEDCSHGRYHCSDAHVLRTTALESLGRISEMGSDLARGKLLALVNFEDKSIQRLAISLFYDTGGMSRWRAQREMKKHLPVSKRHLLYEIK